MSVEPRMIHLQNNEMIDGIALPLEEGDGFLRIPLRCIEDIFIEFPSESKEAECLRSGLADKVGKRIVLLMSDDPETPFRIALKRTIGGHESE